MDRLKSLNDRSKNFQRDRIDRKLYTEFMLSNEFLLLAYNRIRSKPGNMTPGVTPETLDGFSLEDVSKITADLKKETFEFKPTRRIYIPKANGKLRPLSIGSPRDKVVLEAIRMVLEAIYEPLFLDVSHGFRPCRSCHTALKSIYTKYQAVA